VDRSPSEKVIVTQFPHFNEPEALLPYSQEPGTGLYPEPDESRPNLPTLFH